MTKLTEALERIREVARLLPEDDPERQEMMEVEGGYVSLMEWALAKRNDHIAQAEACKELAARYSARQKSFEGRAESMKGIIHSLMIAAQEIKYQGAAGTVSIRDVPPKPIVLDESLLPSDYFKEVRTVDKALINQAIKDGYSIPGVGMDNGGITLTIRTK